MIEDNVSCNCCCSERTSLNTVSSGFFVLPGQNTLEYDPDLCINCGMCYQVCPHGVFAAGERMVDVNRPEFCMECGACQRNCPTGAIRVDSGVGCAAAFIRAALTGRQHPSCGPETTPGCC